MSMNSGFRRLTLVANITATAASLIAPASAQTVLIDLGTDASFRGLSVLNPDTNGNYWNNFAPGDFAVGLIDIDNHATTINFGFTTPVGFDSFNGPAGETGPADNKDELRNFNLPFTDIDAAALGNLGGALEAAFDYFAGTSDAEPDNVVRFEILQLDPNKTYDLTFFGSHRFSDDDTTVYSVYTDNTYSTLVDSAALDVQEPGLPDLHNRDRVATIRNLSPQTGNILYVQFIGTGGGPGYLNAMQIDVVTTVISGDYNGSGVVDLADYTVWRDNLGGDALAAFATGSRDPALSGPIGSDDYAFWNAQFRSTAAFKLGTRTPVPELSTIGIVLAGSAVMVLSRSILRRDLFTEAERPW
jgi:hypothetical protein